ncbi:MAG: NnrS family protein [Acidobacteria bacterium]|nr:NnrS family protein [Acidobacteriota bacterium]
MSTQTEQRLPPQWQAAFERDRLGVTVSNDPVPERRASRMLAAFIISGLLFLALPGTLLGVWNLIFISQHRAGTAANAAWIQAHGQAQLFGWVGTFILGISLYFLPKFLGRTLTHHRAAWVAWALWTAGTAWRWWVGVSTGNWRLGLVASAILKLAAYAAAQYVLWFAGRRPVKATAMSQAQRAFVFWLALVGFIALGVTLIINLVISVQLATTAEFPVYPPEPDRMLLVVALWGFAAPVAWAYSSRFVSVFLGLRPPFLRAAPAIAVGVVVLCVLALARQFLLADIAAVGLTAAAVWPLRVFERAAKPLKRTGVYRHYGAFVRLSFVWLCVAAIIGVLADVFPHQTGLTGASRHAFTVGFLATLIFSIGPRILPSFLNGRELWSSRLMAATLWLISVGCFLRVSSESLAYSSGGFAWDILPISAIVELAAVVIFVVNMGVTLAQKIPAWFSPEGVSPDNLVYFYTAAFPASRRVLIDAGLKTLAEVRDVPRTLTLREAAEADNADVAGLLDALKAFFADRQPRRVQ